MKEELYLANNKKKNCIVQYLYMETFYLIWYLVMNLDQNYSQT